MDELSALAAASAPAEVKTEVKVETVAEHNPSVPGGPEDALMVVQDNVHQQNGNDGAAANHDEEMEDLFGEDDDIEQKDRKECVV